MRICLLAGEIFAYGKYGGFGRATRCLGGELVRRGHEVCAIVPRRRGQGPRETLDGMTVWSYPRYLPLWVFPLCRACRAEVYHSQEPSLSTWLAMQARPRSRHVITFRDTRDAADWQIEKAHPSRSRLAAVLNHWYEDNPLVRRAVRRADAVFCAARVVGAKARAVYGLPAEPPLLPTPVRIPEPPRKADTPTVCYLGRADRRKRPEVFLELAARFPAVRFVLVGDAQQARQRELLRQRSAQLPNLEWKGFVNQFESDGVARVLGASWILVNTSLREGLPNAFLEACAHGCAILSQLDPDGFASRFGYWAARGDYADGLRRLLQEEQWRERGRAGAAYVAATYGLERAVAQHLAVYERLTLTPAARPPRPATAAPGS